MTDEMDRPTKHGLGSPPNDGAPRPNPPKTLQPTVNDGSWPEHWPEPPGGYDQTPEMLDDEDAAHDQAIRHQGYLDGLRKASYLMCYDCGHPIQDGAKLNPAIRQGGRWVHRFAHTDCVRYCPAGSIHDEIAAMPKHGAPPAQPAKAKSQAQQMVTVCASCLQASCFQGAFYCDDYEQAGITQKSVAELTALALEDPSYWEGDS